MAQIITNILSSTLHIKQIRKINKQMVSNDILMNSPEDVNFQLVQNNSKRNFYSTFSVLSTEK